MDFSKKENKDKLNDLEKINLLYKKSLPINFLIKILTNLYKIKKIVLN